MKRFLSVLVLVALMFVSQSALALEKGDQVEVCESEGVYTLLPADMECGGELLQGTVTDVQEGNVVVDLGEGHSVTLPAE